MYMCDWLPQVFPYRNHHCHLCHHSHYAHQNFNALSIIIIPENFPNIPGYSENLPDYSGIFPDSFPTYYAQNYAGIMDSCLLC